MEKKRASRARTRTPKKARPAKRRKRAEAFWGSGRHQSARHARGPLLTPSRLFWSTGLLGAVMVVSAGVISAVRTELVPHRGMTPLSSERAIVVPMAGARVPASTGPAAPLDRAFEEVSMLGVGKRVAWWSRWLSERKDALSDLRILGEGPPSRDTAPWIPRRFNCTTFVETSIALARSARPQEFFARLAQVRYRDGEPHFLARKHFPEVDWVPENARAGVLRDITDEVAQKAGVQLRVAKKTVDRARWLADQKARSSEVSRSIASMGGGTGGLPAKEKVKLLYVPSAEVIRDASWIPEGSVINFVRPDVEHRPVLITHQGIVVSEGGEVLLRHATPGGRVRSVNLGAYLRRNSGFVGVTLNRVSDGARGH